MSDVATVCCTTLPLLTDYTTTAVNFRRHYISRYGIFIKVYYIHLINLLELNPLGAMCRRNLTKGS